MPHLMLVVRNVSRISRISGWQQRDTVANSLVSDRLILLDNKLKPVYYNVRAREICLYLFNRMSPGAFDIERCKFPFPSCIIADCCDLLDLQRVRQPPEVWPKERIIFVNGGKQFRIDCSLIWKSDKSVIIPQFMVTLSDLTRDINLPSSLRAKFSLTRRELEIVHYIVADMSYGEIAEKLCISKLTVHTHVKNIYRKLGVRNKMELSNCVQSPTWLA
jgi:DNA-binding CsgD family transcriptional regulator